MSPSPLSRRPPKASASIAVGISAPQRAGQKVGLLSQKAFQVFLSVFTVQFLRCQWVALLSLRFLSWACSEHVLPASPPPHLHPGRVGPVLRSQSSVARAASPGSCPLLAHHLPDVFTTMCSCEFLLACLLHRPASPLALRQHVRPKCVLSFPGACSLCGLPFMVALGSRFLSVHVLFCQL